MDLAENSILVVQFSVQSQFQVQPSWKLAVVFLFVSTNNLLSSNIIYGAVHVRSWADMADTKVSLLWNIVFLL